MTEKNISCPVCGRYIFDEADDFDICDNCGWENDGVQQRDHNYAGGANELSVNEARIEYFLLNHAKKAEDAKRIRSNYLKFCKQCRSLDEKKAAREKYMDMMNELLNGIRLNR